MTYFTYKVIYPDNKFIITLLKYRRSTTTKYKSPVKTIKTLPIQATFLIRKWNNTLGNSLTVKPRWIVNWFKFVNHQLAVASFHSFYSGAKQRNHLWGPPWLSCPPAVWTESIHFLNKIQAKSTVLWFHVHSCAFLFIYFCLLVIPKLFLHRTWHL